jgi:hypothetical protein
MPARRSRHAGISLESHDERDFPGRCGQLRPEGEDLGFFNRATVYSVQLVRSAPSWFCKSGKEWKGTRLRFHLNETKGQTLLRFTHADWQADTDYFVSCNPTWGALMFRLKTAAEDRLGFVR